MILPFFIRVKFNSASIYWPNYALYLMCSQSSLKSYSKSQVALQFNKQEYGGTREGKWRAKQWGYSILLVVNKQGVDWKNKKQGNNEVLKIGIAVPR